MVKGVDLTDQGRDLVGQAHLPAPLAAHDNRKNLNSRINKPLPLSRHARDDEMTLSRALLF